MGKHLVGVLSDTHGLVRPALARALAGCDLIVHAGDVGKVAVLEALRKVAPVVAVRGNMDFGPWAQALHLTEVVTVGDALLYVLHDLEKLDLDPAAAGLNAVISGHTHLPAIGWRKGILFINPGSAGPSRHGLPASVVLLQVEGKALTTRLVIIPT
ncbi:MAG: metallophosphoesterase family protein [Anaerolineae bacterium]